MTYGINWYWSQEGAPAGTFSKARKRAQLRLHDVIRFKVLFIKFTKRCKININQQQFIEFWRSLFCRVQTLVGPILVTTIHFNV